MNLLMQSSSSPKPTKEESLNRMSKDHESAVANVNNSKDKIKKGKLRKGRTRVFHTHNQTQNLDDSALLKVGAQPSDSDKRPFE